MVIAAAAEDLTGCDVDGAEGAEHDSIQDETNTAYRHAHPKCARGPAPIVLPTKVIRRYAKGRKGL